MPTLDAYIRVSRVGARGGEGFISPEVQREAIEKWAAGREGIEIAWHEPELDVSGGTMERPVFDRIMERVRAGESGGIVVYKVDRFARSLLGGLTVLQAIAQAGADFAAVSDDIDLTTPQGRAFLHMQLVFAQLFREQIREGFATATERAIANGVHISNSVPPGFDRIDRRLVPNGDRTTMREVFLRRARGEGASRIAQFLDEAMPRQDGGNWTAAHVRRLLRMRVYVGEAHHGANRNPNAHEAIVSEAEWQRAQLAREAPHDGQGVGNLLAGLIRCGGCRYMMTPTNAEYPVYRCRKRHTAGRCPSPATILRPAVETYVLEQAAAKLDVQASLDAQPADSEYEAAMERVAELEAELDQFAADTEARALLGDRYHAALKARTDALAEAQRAAQAAMHAESGAAFTLDEWDSWSMDERRRLLASMIDAIFVRPTGRRKVPVEERVVIAWRDIDWPGWDPSALPARGRSNGPIRGFDWPQAEA